MVHKRFGRGNVRDRYFLEYEGVDLSILLSWIFININGSMD
jgi:hypothetical protein